MSEHIHDTEAAQPLAEEAPVPEVEPVPAYQSHTYGNEFSEDQLQSLVVSESENEGEAVAAPSEVEASEDTQAEPEPEIEAEAKDEEVEPEEPTRDDVYVIDGKEYSTEDIQSWMKDSENKTEWQKSNTQKSQDLSAARKALEAELGRWKALRDNSDLMDAIKDYMGDEADNHPLFEAENFESLPAEEEPTEPVKQSETEVEQLKDRVAEMEAQIQVERDLQQLVQSHPELQGNEKAIKAVIDTMIARQLPTLEDAFIITNANSTEKSAFKKAKKAIAKAQESKKVPVQTGEGRGSRSKPVPKLETFRDIRDYAAQHYDLVE